MVAKNVKTEDAAESQSLKIWNQIKDIDLELFALPGQTVEKHASPVLDMSKTELHLLLKTSAALPVLEEVVRKFGLVVDRKEKFVVVKKS